ncbi:hypothetical protein LRS74_30055 [Streptomyces sp. LX-29]|uniref:hypothetical protein n=1 Tax=Streptomyces sp. LX-29 TaxID=2900152 RepID=UPI00240DCAB3|nr:hypothetical protein [Streptomyces sp. LX-29]WFB10815.1 hypothetical protein LRS74_30055 [Streptomyces sp. LX-29]
MNAAFASSGAPAEEPLFEPTHIVPRYGLPTWAAPDGVQALDPLDPLLPVRLAERRGDWAQVVCSNGWAAWVDGRLLLPVPHDPPTASHPPRHTDDPRPLLARVEETLSRYRRAVEEVAAGRTDGEAFRGDTEGLRLGVIVDGPEVWLYDAEHDAWTYGDGAALMPFAASEQPVSGAGRATGAPPTTSGSPPTTSSSPPTMSSLSGPGAPGASGAPAGPGSPGASGAPAGPGSPGPSNASAGPGAPGSSGPPGSSAGSGEQVPAGTNRGGRSEADRSGGG